jgi:hypothetical protein
MLFHEAMSKFNTFFPVRSFERFEKAAAKGHEESIWIGSVGKDVEIEKNAWKEAFAKTEEPLGWYFAGELSVGRERFDCSKKSAEGGCSWGQVEYGWYFKDGLEFVEEDKKVFVGWLEKAANQNNPRAMEKLGDWFRHDGDDEEKAVSYQMAGAELGWKWSMHFLAEMLKVGEGCAKDIRQAVKWSAKGGSFVFWNLLGRGTGAMDSRATEYLDCDFNQFCYLLGWGLYWYQYEGHDCKYQSDENQAFANHYLDYYCSCVEIQQESIFAFLLCWNQTTGGVKDVGVLIGKMVWEGREDSLLKGFKVRRE